MGRALSGTYHMQGNISHKVSQHEWPGLSSWQDHSLQPVHCMTDMYVPHAHHRTYMVLGTSTRTHTGLRYAYLPWPMILTIPAGTALTSTTGHEYDTVIASRQKHKHL